jgi:hypothetical protein
MQESRGMHRGMHSCIESISISVEPENDGASFKMIRALAPVWACSGLWALGYTPVDAHSGDADSSCMLVSFSGGFFCLFKLVLMKLL